MKLRYTSRARGDLDIAFAWYEEQRYGLGFEFHTATSGLSLLEGTSLLLPWSVLKIFKQLSSLKKKRDWLLLRVNGRTLKQCRSNWMIWPSSGKMVEPEEMFLFDTDVITNVLKKRPSRKLLDRLACVPMREQFITTITISEIVYGASKSNRPEYHLKNLKDVLLPSVNVVGFDSKSAYIYGRLRARLEQSGTPLDLADLEIAAIAIAGELVLVTGNFRHFKRVSELSVENWLV